MNGLIKWLLRTAAILFCAGALLALGGWALGGQTRMEVNVAGRDITVGPGVFHFVKASGAGPREELSVVDRFPLDELEVDTDLVDVYLHPGDGYGLSLSWSDERYALHYTSEDGKLKIGSSALPVGTKCYNLFNISKLPLTQQGHTG